MVKFNSSIFFLATFVFISCASLKQAKYNPEQKIAAADLRDDMSLLKRIFEANHPSLYWYTSKDSLDNFFDATLSTITDSLTERQFKNKVASVVSKIHCGHTAVRTSKNYTNYFVRKRIPLFPLSLKVWDDSMVIGGNAFRNDTILKRGTIITGINNYSNRQLLDSMFQFISTDGYANNFKQQLISFNFPAYYRNTFGVDSQYIIHYIDNAGRAKTTVVKSFFARRDTSQRRQIETQPRLTKKEIRKFNHLSKRSMEIDTLLNTAILNVNTFSDGTLNRFFKQSFEKIKEQRLQNVVIDLRENGGGNILSSTRLTQYLIDHPFHVADTVAAITRSFSYHKYIHPWFIYWLGMHVTSHRHSNDDRIHFKYFEHHQFKPKSNFHFDGHIYIVTGGFTFSASTLFAGSLKGQKNVTIVGEETGGGYYGNTAMHLPVITLPNSKVRIVLPLYRMVINSDRIKNGRGIFPDVEVKPSSVAIRKGIDGKMQKVRELILKSRY